MKKCHFLEEIMRFTVCCTLAECEECQWYDKLEEDYCLVKNYVRFMRQMREFPVDCSTSIVSRRERRREMRKGDGVQ